MKKKLIVLASGLMLVALSVAFFANKSQDSQTSLLMRNVEALANDESGGGRQVTCYNARYHEKSPYTTVYKCGNPCLEWSGNLAISGSSKCYRP